MHGDIWKAVFCINRKGHNGKTMRALGNLGASQLSVLALPKEWMRVNMQNFVLFTKTTNICALLQEFGSVWYRDCHIQL